MEGREIQLPGSNHVSLSYLNHLSKLGNALPRRVEEITSKGVESQVYTLATGLAHDFVHEAVVAGVEDAVSGEIECLHQILGLFVAADGGVDVCLEGLCELQGSEADASAGTVDENRLYIYVRRLAFL